MVLRYAHLASEHLKKAAQRVESTNLCTAPEERLVVNRKQLKLLVARDGIEPPTRGFLGPVKSITY
jgi:hypothetical protein